MIQKNTPNFYYFKKIFLHFEWLKKYFELQIKIKPFLWVGTPIFKKISLEFIYFYLVHKYLLISGSLTRDTRNVQNVFVT